MTSTSHIQSPGVIQEDVQYAQKPAVCRDLVWPGMLRILLTTRRMHGAGNLEDSLPKG